ncbi:YadA-like family protein [Fusobacterium animalis]|uniref:YadA-like family protein n=1 Tax=Fusobacterium animalis TaxID=76859 RepID=UPI00325009FA
MKKRNLQLLALSLFLVLAQNSFAVKLEQGTGSEAASEETVAIGLSYTDGSGTVHKNIAGNPAESAEKYYAAAIGIANIAKGKYSSAIGRLNKASGMGSSAFGAENIASGEASTAIGRLNKASGMGSSAFGYQNEASGDYSSAIGCFNTASGESSSAFGSENTASRDYSSAIGRLNTASGKWSSAFGAEYEVSGQRSGAFGAGFYNGATYDYKNEGNNSYMFGNYNKIAAGTENNFILGNNVSIGSGIQNSVALGNNSTVSSSNEVSVGSEGKERKITNVGDGVVSNTSTDAVTGRQLFSGDGIDTAAWKAKLGVGSGGVDLTPYTKRDTSNLTASDVTTWQTKLDVTKKVDYKDANDIDVNKWKAKLGVGSGGVDLTPYTKKDASNLTATDISAWRTKLGVGAGGGGIANTATGTGSTGLGVDNAVTGDYSTAVGYKNKVTGNKSGAFGDPNLVTGNGSYAFGNDNTIKGDNNFVFGNNVTIETTIQNSVALGNNSTVSSSNEVSVGSKGKERKITNVADGELSATSTDAVNGRQLYKAMQNSGALGIENLRNEVYEKIDNVKDEVRDIGSLSAALAGLHPMQYDPKAPAQVMAALGHYKNRQAVAVGASYYFNDRFMMSTGVALSGEKKTKAMANVGFTLKLGKGSGVSYNETPQYVVQNEVKRLTVENQELKSKVNNQDNRIKVQDNKIKEQDEKIKNLEEKLNKLLKTK